MTTTNNNPPLDPAALRKLAQDALELAEKATKGPWWAGDDDFPTTLNAGVGKDLLTGITWNEGEIVEGYTQGMFKLVEDAEFTAKTRQLVPNLATALLAALERVSELEDRVKQVRKEYHDFKASTPQYRMYPEELEDLATEE